MATAIVTGSCGLVGSEAVEFLIDRGMKVIGIDNDLRGSLFGKEGSNWARRAYLIEKYGEMGYTHYDIDIRDQGAVFQAWPFPASEVELVFHTAGQPSHDWSAKNPREDFEVNATGTLNMLELVHTYSPNAVFVYMSTNKVYGDFVNGLDFEELSTRYAPKWETEGWEGGMDETTPIDHSMHSPFGVSKLAADLMVQEYGRYFGMKTVCFRCGCITGQAHAGVSLHGFLAYLAKCVREKQTYTVIGYKGKQVRDNIHAYDVCTAMWEFYRDPKCGAVYNLGGGLSNSCSILEAMAGLTKVGDLPHECASRYIEWDYQEQPRKGDHKWWITDTGKFQRDYPVWRITRGLPGIYKELLQGGLK